MRSRLVAVLVCCACSAPTSPDDAGTAGGSAGGGAAGGSAGGGDAGGSTAGSGGGTAGGTAGGSGGSSGGTAGGSGGGATSSDGGRASFFGASRCADAGLQLCEDFESGALNPATWQQTGAASLAVSTGDFARGARALHITKVGNGSAYIRETKTFPATNDTYWARAFVKFISLPKPQPDGGMTYAHWTIAAATGTVVAGEIRISGQLSNNRNLFGVGTDNRTQDAGTGDWTLSDRDPNNMPRTVPLDEWMCLEWLHDGQHDETRFFWDGVEHPSLHTTATVHGGNSNPYLLPEFNALWFGWAEYQGSSETFELWIDEIAVDPARIGCTR